MSVTSHICILAPDSSVEAELVRTSQITFHRGFLGLSTKNQTCCDGGEISAHYHHHIIPVAPHASGSAAPPSSGRDPAAAGSCLTLLQ